MSTESILHSAPVLSKRNQFMELMKFIASFFVIFLHAQFPGKFGALVYSLGQFAVPMFFMISGYFHYGATLSQIRRRARHILLLLLAGALFRVFMDVLVIEIQGGSTVSYLISYIPEPDEILRMLTIQQMPYSGHLWYLMATLLCYGVLAGFIAFQGESSRNYKPFYCLCLAPTGTYFAVEVISPIAGLGDISLRTHNGWFMGLPMFAMGLFMAQYRQRLIQAFHLTPRRLLALIALGMGIILLQWLSQGTNNGAFGILIAVPALILLMVHYPKLIPSVRGDRFFAFLGSLSMWIYLVHIAIQVAYLKAFQPQIVQTVGHREPWISPLLVAAGSLAAALVLHSLSLLWAALSRKWHQK